MLGDTDEARRYYVEAAGVGAENESEAGLRACAADEQQASRLHAELIMCRRAAASTVGSTSSAHQLKSPSPRSRRPARARRTTRRCARCRRRASPRRAA